LQRKKEKALEWHKKYLEIADIKKNFSIFAAVPS